MTRDRVRALLIALFAAAAILSGAGNATGTRLLTAIGFVCFAAGAVVLLRWRRRLRARVFVSEEKTGGGREGEAPE
jgi:Flp pilus assembly protein TadB